MAAKQPMTVGRLIEKLQQYDKNKIIKTWDPFLDKPTDECSIYTDIDGFLIISNIE